MTRDDAVRRQPTCLPRPRRSTSTGEHYNRRRTCVEELREPDDRPRAATGCVVELRRRRSSRHCSAAAACARRRASVRVSIGAVPPDATADAASARSWSRCHGGTGARDYVARARGLCGRSSRASAPSTNTDLRSDLRRARACGPQRWQFVMVADLHEDGVGPSHAGVPAGYTLTTWEGDRPGRDAGRAQPGVRGPLRLVARGARRCGRSGSPAAALPARAEPGRSATSRAPSRRTSRPVSSIAVRGGTGDPDVPPSSRSAPRPSIRRRGLAEPAAARRVASLPRRRASTVPRSTSTRRTRPVRWRVYERVGFRTTMRLDRLPA